MWKPFPVIPYRPPGDSESPPTIPSLSPPHVILSVAKRSRRISLSSRQNPPPPFIHLRCPRGCGDPSPSPHLPSSRPSSSPSPVIPYRLVIPNPGPHVIQSPGPPPITPFRTSARNLVAGFRPPHTLSSRGSTGNLAGFHSPSRPLPRRLPHLPSSPTTPPPQQRPIPIPKPNPPHVAATLIIARHMRSCDQPLPYRRFPKPPFPIIPYRPPDNAESPPHVILSAAQRSRRISLSSRHNLPPPLVIPNPHHL